MTKLQLYTKIRDFSNVIWKGYKDERRISKREFKKITLLIYDIHKVFLKCDYPEEFLSMFMGMFSTTLYGINSYNAEDETFSSYATCFNLSMMRMIIGQVASLHESILKNLPEQESPEMEKVSEQALLYYDRFVAMDKILENYHQGLMVSVKEWEKNHHNEKM